MARGRATGPGRIHLYRISNVVQAALYNFDVDGTEVDGAVLKREHAHWLGGRVAHILRQGGRAAIIGQASRTWHADYNRDLSRRRGDAVIAHLRQVAGANLRIASYSAVGEERAAEQGAPNDVENDWYRSVLIMASQRPPPRPPSPPPQTPAIQLPCAYYDFWIAWNTAVAQAWALSLGRGATPGPGSIWEEAPSSGGGAGPEYLFYGKPDQEHFIACFRAAFSHSTSFTSQNTTTAALAAYEWYQGEVMPNGGYTFIHDSHRRISQLRQDMRAGCTGSPYDPPWSGSAGTPSPSPTAPQRDPRGRYH
jgi:hypothetical protein